MKSVVVHYQEIALKGNNRPWFIARLARNLRLATADLGVREVRVLMGRIELVLGDDGRLAGGSRSAAGASSEWPISRKPGGRRSMSTPSRQAILADLDGTCRIRERSGSRRAERTSGFR